MINADCSSTKGSGASMDLEERLKQAEALLEEALVKVEADEQAQAESWPGEVREGELILDLGKRIRVYLNLPKLVY